MAPFPDDLFKEDNFNAPSFLGSRAIDRMHAVPRFGHGSDINVILDINSSDSTKRDYLVGILVCSICIFILFIVWCIVLIVLRSLGPKRVSFCSGKKPIVPPPPHVDFREDDTKGSPDVNKESVDSNESTTERYTNEGEYDMIDGGDETIKSEKETNEDGPEKKSSSITTTSPNDDNGISHAIPFGEGQQLTDQSRAQGSEDSTAKEVASEEQGSNKLDSNPLDEWNKEVERVDMLIRNTRIAVLVCSLVIIVFSVLYIVLGVHPLINSLDDAQDGLDDIDRVAQEAMGLTVNFLESQDKLNNVTDKFMNKTLIDWCPRLVHTNFTNCSDLIYLVPNSTSLNLSDCNITLPPLQDEVDELKEALDEMRESIRDGVLDLQDDLEETMRITENIRSYVNDFYWAGWVAFGFGIFYIVIIVILMIGIIMSWKEKLTKPFGRFHRGFMMPLFCICLFLSWLFATIFLVGAINGADFCETSPDPRLQYLLSEYEDDFTPFWYSLIDYYISGCKTEQYPPEFEKQMHTLLNVTYVVLEFVTAIENYNGTVDLGTVCGVNETHIVQEAKLIDATIHVDIYTLEEVREFFFCSNMNPIYTEIVYDAVCYNGVHGLRWIFTCEFVIAIFSLIMLTLRVAWLEVDAELDAETVSGEEHVEESVEIVTDPEQSKRASAEVVLEPEQSR